MVKIKRLFWDIETSPNIGYFWRSGWKLNIAHDNIIQERAVICICWKWEGKKRVHALTWKDGDDKQMIKKFLKVAMEADELIAHNGDRFDLSWFQGRCLSHGFDPLPEFKTVDTLAISRRNFNFNSHKLDYLGKHLLGEGKIHTDFDLWIKVCDGNKSAMREMVTYCRKDVVILEKVWDRLKSFYRPKTHVGVLQGKSRWTCPHDGHVVVRKTKNRVTAAGMKRHQMQCNKCKRYYTIPNNVFEQYKDSRGIK